MALDPSFMPNQVSLLKTSPFLQRWLLMVVVSILAVLVHLGLAFPVLSSSWLSLLPDAPEFILGGKSLVRGMGYRDVSNPNFPPLTRPPGMSLLLAPVSMMEGYHIVVCKGYVFLVTVSGLFALAWITSLYHKFPTGLCLLGVLAANPVQALYNGNLYSEAFFAVVVASLWALFTWQATKTKPTELAQAPPSWAFYAAVGLLATAAILVRSHGVVLWLALLLWGWPRRRRGRTVVVVVLGVAGTILLDRLMGAGGAAHGRYWPHFLNSWHAQGLGGFTAGALAAATMYTQTFASVWLPVFAPEFRDQFPLLNSVPQSVVLGAGLVVVAIAAWGWLCRWRVADPASEASFIAAYVVFMFLLLLVWPHRLPRLTFPLAGIMAVFFWPTVWNLPSRFWARALTTLGFLGYATAWGFWLFPPPVQNPEKEQYRVMGQWLQAHTPASTRVLADNHRLFFNSGRWQETLFSTTLSLEDFNAIILSRRIRYVHLTSWYHDAVVVQNPEFLFEPVANEEGLFPLLRVVPNRMGLVAATLPGSAAALARLDQAQPEVDLQTYTLFRAGLQLRLGLPAQAKETLQAYFTKRGKTSTLYWMQLGDILVVEQRWEEAIASYRMAEQSANADFYQEAASAGIQLARLAQQMENPAQPAATRAQWLAKLARGHTQLGHWREALETAQRSLTLHETVAARLVEALVLRRLGRFEEATRSLQHAFVLLARQQRGPTDAEYKDAFRQLLLIKAVPVFEAGQRAELLIDTQRVPVNGEDPNEYIALANLLGADQLSGKALALLETANKRFPQASALWMARGDMLVLFGEISQAREAYHEAARLDPSSHVDALLQQLDHLEQQIPIR